MFVHKNNELDPVGGTETPEKVVNNRRRFLRTAGVAAGASLVGVTGYAGWQWYRGSDEEVLASGVVRPAPAKPDQESAPVDADYLRPDFYPAQRDERFEYGRPETIEAEAARYTNFYEFSVFKRSWRYVDKFQPTPWMLTVDGLCRQPLKLDFGDLLARYRDSLVERQYRHRCVETWAMAVPWTGIPLAELIKAVDPLPGAKYVQFTSFNRPEQAPGIANKESFPWPYTEGLTLAEATNELTLLATGMYGHPLLKQHGAPVRLVVPWKYGYKSIKSIERIDLLPREPATFWTTLAPEAYPFESNVEPEVARPWPQNSEHMLGTGERYPTLLYNGYEKYVADLYSA